MSRRLRQLRISPEVVMGMMMGINRFHCWGTVDGVPDDTKVLSVHIDNDRRLIHITVEHDSFEEVPDTCTIPCFDIAIVQGEIALKEAIKENWFKIYMEQVLAEREGK